MLGVLPVVNIVSHYYCVEGIIVPSPSAPLSSVGLDPSKEVSDSAAPCCSPPSSCEKG